MWFLLWTSIDVLDNNRNVTDGAWQSVLDCIDKFVAVVNLGGQSAS